MVDKGYGKCARNNRNCGRCWQNKLKHAVKGKRGRHIGQKITIDGDDKHLNCYSLVMRKKAFKNIDICLESRIKNGASMIEIISERYKFYRDNYFTREEAKAYSKSDWELNGGDKVKIEIAYNSIK